MEYTQTSGTRNKYKKKEKKIIFDGKKSISPPTKKAD